MKINFSKYNGAGNDFILIDDRENLINDNKSLISYLCNRHFGIGGDGLIILKESSNSEFEILHYTSDGNLGSLCGNGSRCAVLFAYNKDIISKKTVFHAFDGIHNAEILDNGLIKMEMKLVGVRPVSESYFNQLPKDLKEKRVKYKPGCIPPYVALDLGSTKEAVLKAEELYLEEKEKNPNFTDLKYFFIAIYKIIFQRKRSA